MSEIAERIASVRARIAIAAQRAGRDPAGVLLVGATKTVPPERIAEAAACGLEAAGENRAQELKAKRDALAGDPRAASLAWHFIGALQRNKARLVAGRVALVHGVGSIAVAEELAARAARAGAVQDVLFEVNLSGEGKPGVRPADAVAVAARAAALDGIRIRGLMGIPPSGEPPRPSFRALRELGDRLRHQIAGAVELSMGMSDDLDEAVEEGATIVRVGTAIFGPRPRH